ncbi:MAG: LPS export ABC transporter periplasmic protein LptC [Deltaproteobacteria bacterium]|nr:LPS export ABC transporter periplasmic protein LptC [Deltaproteobacteria bacterium]
MKRRFRFFLSLFLLFAFGAMAISLVINSTKVQKGVSGVKDVVPPKADVTLDRIHYTETRDSQKAWELEAASARYFKEKDITIFDKVKVIFYSKEGRTYTMEAREGMLVNSTKEVEVKGEVIVTSDDGYQLKTDSMRVSSNGKQFSTNDRIVLKGPRIELEGVGVLIDTQVERLSVLGEVKTVLKGGVNL